MSLPPRITETIARHLKLQLLNRYLSRIEVTGKTPGGDARFFADDFAEQALADRIAAEGWNVAVYTEDRGLVRFGEAEPEGLLIVDPIDGTRPFNAGIPVSTVSVALASYGAEPAFDDVTEGCLVELASDRALFAAGDGPPEIVAGGKRIEPKRYPHEDLTRMSWAFEVAGRPAQPIADLLGDLIDRTSLTGGCFTFASSAYAISKVVEGTLGAFIDVGGWLLDAGLMDEETAMGLYPYDIAAAYRIARNAGCNVTDVYGRPLSDVPLTGSGPDAILSCVVTSNIELHRAALAYLKESAERVLGAGT